MECKETFTLVIQTSKHPTSIADRICLDLFSSSSSIHQPTKITATTPFLGAHSMKRPMPFTVTHLWWLNIDEGDKEVLFPVKNNAHDLHSFQGVLSNSILFYTLQKVEQ